MTIPDAEKAKIERINEISLMARTTWFGLLAYLAFVGVTLLAVEDADFFLETRKTQLPIIGVEIPTASFFWFAPVLGAALYTYLHIQLMKLWEALIEPPPSIDGKKLQERIYPWLINDLALGHRDDEAMRRGPLSWLSGIVTCLLVWIAGPFVLTGFWWRSMPAHDEWMTLLIALALMIALYVGFTSWWHMKNVMRRAWKGVKTKHRNAARGWLRAVWSILRRILAGLLWLVTRLVVWIAGPFVLALIWSRADAADDHSASQVIALLVLAGLYVAATNWWRLSNAIRRAWRGPEPTDNGERKTPSPWRQGWKRQTGWTVAAIIIATSWLRTEGGFDYYANGLVNAWNDMRGSDWMRNCDPRDETDDDLDNPVRPPDCFYKNSDRKPRRVVQEERVAARWWGLPLERLTFNTRSWLIGFIIGRDEHWTPLAPTDLSNGALGWPPEDWRDRDQALRRFREAWCARRELALDTCRGFRHLERLPMNEDRVAARAAWCSHRKFEGKVCSERFSALEAEFRQEWQEERDAYLRNLDDPDQPRRDLREANLSNAFLADTFLRDARLQQASLRWARLEGADLSWARLEGANLREARLEGADLIGARLERAGLIGARLEGASLVWAWLDGAALIGARLEGADLREAWLEGANLNSARLEGVDLREAWLEGADLRRVRLEGANLFKARLRSADLRDWSIARASLRSADLTTVKNLDPRSLSAAFGDSGTVLPEGFARPCHWDTNEIRGSWKTAVVRDTETILTVGTARLEDDEKYQAWIAAGAPPGEPPPPGESCPE